MSLAPEYDLSRSSAAARVPWCYLLNWESLGGAESEQSGQTRARGIHIKYPLKEHNRAFAFIFGPIQLLTIDWINAAYNVQQV